MLYFENLLTVLRKLFSSNFHKELNLKSKDTVNNLWLKLVWPLLKLQYPAGASTISAPVGILLHK